MIDYKEDFLLKNKNIYSCLVKLEDLQDKNFGLRTPKIEIKDREEIIKLTKEKYGSFKKGFSYFIQQLEIYLDLKYTNLYKTKYRYLQIFKKNKVNIVFLRVISLCLTKNIKESIKLFNKLIKYNNQIKIVDLIIKTNKFGKGMSYLIGVISGDGHLNKKNSNLEISDGQSNENKLKLSKKYLEFIDGIFKKEFNITGKMTKEGKCWRYRINNKWLCRFINQYFEIPFGKKSNIIKLPENILNSNERYFWRGLMDTDGFVREKRKQISFKSNSIRLIKQFKEFCEKNNMVATIRKEKRGWGLRILTKSFLNYAKIIGFSHPRKKDVFLSHLKEGPKYKILKDNPNKSILFKFLKPYKDVVYINFSEHNQKTNKRIVKKRLSDISKTFNVKITRIKRKRYNDSYCICSKKFVDFIKNNASYELPWQPLNNSEINNLSNKYEL